MPSCQGIQKWSLKSHFPVRNFRFYASTVVVSSMSHCHCDRLNSSCHRDLKMVVVFLTFQNGRRRHFFYLGACVTSSTSAIAVTSFSSVFPNGRRRRRCYWREVFAIVAGSARHRLLTCDPERWQTGFYPHLLDGFFLWTLLNSEPR